MHMTVLFMHRRPFLAGAFVAGSLELAEVGQLPSCNQPSRFKAKVGQKRERLVKCGKSTMELETACNVLFCKAICNGNLPDQ